MLLRYIGGAEVQFHSFFISVLDEGEWSTWRRGRFIPRATHLIGGWVGLSAGLDVSDKTNISCLRHI
jgi:hypothetical protein